MIDSWEQSGIRFANDLPLSWSASAYRKSVAMPFGEQCTIDENNSIRLGGAFLSFVSEATGRDDISAKCLLFLNDAFELLNGRPSNSVVRCITLALNNDNSVRVKHIAIDTEVI